MMAGFESSLFPDPNPPRDIFIKKMTTKSIFVEWAPAFFMDDSDGFNYTVIISSSSGTADYSTKASYQNLTSLSSETPHNICVRTTGPLGLQSESVCSYVTTSKCSKPGYIVSVHWPKTLLLIYLHYLLNVCFLLSTAWNDPWLIALLFIESEQWVF